MRAVHDRENVRLLRSRRKTGARSDSSDVEDHDRDFGVIREPDKFLHQRNSRSGGRRHGARSGPAGADSHADGSQFVFRLNDCKACFAVLFDAVVLHVVPESFAEAG